MYYIYTLRCADGSLYTGITTDVKRRMRQHLGHIKGGAKYTARHRPESLVMLWQTEEKSPAMRLEYAIKHLPKSDKERLIRSPRSLPALCPKLDSGQYLRLSGTPYSLSTANTPVHPKG